MKPLLLLCALLIGCSDSPPIPARQPVPLAGRGVVTGNKDGVVWMTYDSGQMAEYTLCDDSNNLAAVGEGVDVHFTWNAKKGCYNQTSAYAAHDLDKKDDSK